MKSLIMGMAALTTVFSVQAQSALHEQAAQALQARSNSGCTADGSAGIAELARQTPLSALMPVLMQGATVCLDNRAAATLSDGRALIAVLDMQQGYIYLNPQAPRATVLKDAADALNETINQLMRRGGRAPAHMLRPLGVAPSTEQNEAPTITPDDMNVARAFAQPAPL